jgi:hypothetical protein
MKKNTSEQETLNKGKKLIYQRLSMSEMSMIRGGGMENPDKPDKLR